jgi:Flp pilus assembly protein TadD
VFFRRDLACLLLGAAIGSSACRHVPSAPVVRIAVIPWENLSTREAIDWIGPVAPYEISARTVGDPHRVFLAAGSERDLLPLRAQQVLSGYYEAAANTLRVHVTLRDLATSRNLMQFEVDGGMPEKLYTAVSARLSAVAGSSSESNEAALAAFGRALLSSRSGAKRDLLAQALKADPHYAPAAALLAQMISAAGDPQSAAAILETARSGRRDGWAWAQLTQELGAIRRDPALLRKGLESSAKLSPANADISRALGEFQVQHHRYPEAAKWFRKTVDLEPGVTAFWNLLAYAQAYARDFAGARASTAQYRKLAPSDPNAWDTTGEVEWYAGNFAAAESAFLEAQQKQPLFLGGLEFSKAAFARFLAGDLTGADQTYHRYLETRRALKDPLTDLREVHWWFLTARRGKALERVASLAQAEGDAGSRAGLFQALFLLEEGKSAEALAAAGNAAKKAADPSGRTTADLMVLLAQPPASANEWLSRVDRALPPTVPSTVRRQVLIYALILGKHYAPAVKLLESAYGETPPPAAEENRMLLGKALLATGNRQRAAEMLTNYPLPPQPGETLFATLYFPGFLEWRKAVGLAAAAS